MKKKYELIKKEVCGTKEESKRATDSLRSIAGQGKEIKPVVRQEDLNFKDNPHYDKLFDTLDELSKRHHYYWWDSERSNDNPNKKYFDHIQYLIVDIRMEELPPSLDNFISQKSICDLANDSENMQGTLQTYSQQRAYAHATF